MMSSAAGMIDLGDAGVLTPGRWRWLRAIVWMMALFAVEAILLFQKLPLPASYEPIAWVVLTVAGYGVYAVSVRYGERRTPTEIALRPLPAELLIGLAIGAGMFTLVFATLRLTGAYTLAPGTWNDWPTDMLSALRTGLAEELLLRLVVFRLLMRVAGLWPALAVSATLFGAMHLANPHSTFVAAIAIAVEAGLMLAAFYLLTGRIWMAVGVHVSWNFSQGPLFGARVSGGTEAGSAFVSGPVVGSPDWLSGGAFGPEASLPAVIAGIALFALVLRAALQRHRKAGTSSFHFNE